MMKDMIIHSMAQLGWQRDRIVDAFSKTFKTAVAPKQASIWLRFDQESDCWLLSNGDFTSAGENVLATCYATFPVNMPLDQIKQAIETLNIEMERKIAGAYSVRLLG